MVVWVEFKDNEIEKVTKDESKDCEYHNLLINYFLWGPQFFDPRCDLFFLISGSLVVIFIASSPFKGSSLRTLQI